MVPASVPAAVRNWDGSVSDSWQVAGNWVENDTPDAGDTVDIAVTNDLIYLYGDTSQLASLTVRAGARLNTNFHFLNLSGGTATVYDSGEIIIRKFSDFDPYSFSAGTVHVATFGTLRLLGGQARIRTELVNDSLGTIRGAGELLLTRPGGGYIANAGTIIADDPNTALTITSVEPYALDLDGADSGDGNGKLTATAGDIVINGALLDPFNGTLTVGGAGRSARFNSGLWLGHINHDTSAIKTAGTLSFANGTAVSPGVFVGTYLAVDGKITVAASSHARIDSPPSFGDNANVTVNAGAVLTLNGVTTFTRGGVYTGAGELALADDTTVSGNTTIATGVLRWSSSATDDVTVDNNAVFTVNSASNGTTNNLFRGTLTLRGDGTAMNVNTTAPWTIPDPGTSLLGHSINFNFVPGTVYPTLGGSAKLRFAGRMTVNGGGAITAPFTFIRALQSTPFIDTVLSTLEITGAFGSETNALLQKTGSGQLRITGAQSHGVGAVLHVAAGSLSMSTDAGAGGENLALNVTGGNAFLRSTQRLAGLSISTGGRVTLTAGLDKVLKTRDLSLTGSATLDLTDNKLIVGVGNVGTSSGGVYGGVTGLIQSGFNEGSWNGSGITTSMPDAASGLTSLGIATADQAGYTLFGGISVGGSDVLVMYTYGGDANLDGFISGDDYSTIDFNFGTSADGWYNGDFNYDGIISGDDYSTIDFNYAAQGAPFPTSGAAAPAAAVAVPEPVASFLLLLAPLARRRRREVRRSA
ncbi:MAG: autotransporter family porin [Phycisphaerales bacterium]|nr:autotransporter family porin [Phycisphaerales bacterium]